MQNNNIKLKIALLSVCLVTASLNAITANIPEIAATFSTIPLYIIELIATIPSFFQMIGVLGGKSIALRIGHKKSIMLGLAMCGIGGVLPVFIQNFVLIFSTRCLLGLGCGLISSALLTLIIHFFNGETRSAMIGFTGSVGGLGSALSSFIAGRLLVWGWNASFAVYFSAFAVLLLITAFVPDARLTASIQASPQSSNRRHSCQSWIPLIAFTLLSFTSTLLATFFIVKASTLITSTGLGSAQDGSLAITFISIGSLLAGAMYGKLYARMKDAALALFYVVSAAGLFCGIFSSLAIIYIGSFLIGWGLIAFSPYFQEKVSQAFPHFGETGTSMILISQALGAFAAPYYGNLLSLFTSQLNTQFFLTGVIYLLLAAIAGMLGFSNKNKQNRRDSA